MGLALAEIICATAFAFELTRALSGNSLSWAYVFEWPILGLYAAYMWQKILKEDRAEGTSSPTRSAALEVDPRLSAYNDYLSRIHGVTNQGPKTNDHD